MFNISLPSFTGETTSDAQLTKKLLEYLLHLSKQLQNMEVSEGDLDKDLTEKISEAVQKAVDSLKAAEAAKKAADTQAKQITDIGSDSKITAVEKLTAKQLWDAIVEEGTPTTGTLTAKAIALEVSVTDFDTAYAALDTYLNTTLGVFASMGATTNIVRTAWDTAWNDYYDERTKLQNAIGEKASILVAAIGTFSLIDLANPVETYLGMRLGQFAANPSGWSGVAPGSGIRWNIGNAYEWGLVQDQYGNPTLWSNDYFYLRALLGVTISDDLWVGDNCSAQSFTDRTPAFAGDALAAIENIKSDKDGNIDHGSLPDAARKKVKVVKRNEKGQKETAEEDGRDIGMMISILVCGTQELLKTVKQQGEIIEKLSKQNNGNEEKDGKGAEL